MVLSIVAISPTRSRWPREVAEDRPLPLDVAARFLPLVAAAGQDYDAWAKRWLIRWLSEAQRPTIDVAAELAATLADGATEPQAFAGILGMLS
jgi:hypothetical protein